MTDRPAGINGTVVNQVVIASLGFGEGWHVRPPLVPASAAQADDIVAAMRKYTEHYQLPPR